MAGRRVVVTGLGLVTPLGLGVEHVWSRLVKAESGIGSIRRFDASDLACTIAGEVPEGPRAEGGWSVEEWIDSKEQRKIQPFIAFAMAAADEAIADSGWKPEGAEQLNRTGVMIGSGIGGLDGIAGTANRLADQGPRRVSPFFIPANLINLAAGNVSIRHGFRGPNHAVVTACASGAHAIGDAARLIEFDDADVMVAGGTEAAICRLGIAGFASARALSTAFNDRPEEASRPWDKDRDGFVMGEGAGIVILEELEHARARSAHIYAEISGYGMSGDAHHITAPAEDGDGGYRAMKAAVRRAAVDLGDIGYVNAHGTSTPLGDVIEINAIKRLFGDHAKTLLVSSTKSAIGHLLGAAGAVEAVFSIKAVEESTIPPTLNLVGPSEGCDLDLVPLEARQHKIRHVLSNSFGFGGTNACLVLSAAP